MLQGNSLSGKVNNLKEFQEIPETNQTHWAPPDRVRIRLSTPQPNKAELQRLLCYTNCLEEAETS